MKQKIGLLVMAYGTPYKPEDIEPYYTHIRHGRRPTDEQFEDLQSRYQSIGGVSPLAEITLNQAKALEKQLNTVQEDVEFVMYLGLKHIQPFLEDAVKKMHEDGIEEAVTLVLAPHYSTFSVKSYNDRAIETAQELGGPKLYTIESWYKEPQFIQYWVDRVKETLSSIPSLEQEKSVVVFSAHSLPEKILAAGDPYPEQLKETAHLIAEKAEVPHFAIGWQSAGNTPDPWIGPDVQDLTRDLYREHQYSHFIYCPIGFVSEHLEVLYDNDYECKVVTDELGVTYHRPAMPNDQPQFIECLSKVVIDRLNER